MLRILMKNVFFVLCLVLLFIPISFAYMYEIEHKSPSQALCKDGCESLCVGKYMEFV